MIINNRPVDYLLSKTLVVRPVLLLDATLRLFAGHDRKAGPQHQLRTPTKLTQRASYCLPKLRLFCALFALVQSLLNDQRVETLDRFDADGDFLFGRERATVHGAFTAQAERGFRLRLDVGDALGVGGAHGTVDDGLGFGSGLAGGQQLSHGIGHGLVGVRLGDIDAVGVLGELQRLTGTLDDGGDGLEQGLGVDLDGAVGQCFHLGGAGCHRALQRCQGTGQGRFARGHVAGQCRRLAVFAVAPGDVVRVVLVEDDASQFGGDACGLTGFVGLGLAQGEAGDGHDAAAAQAVGDAVGAGQLVAVIGEIAQGLGVDFGIGLDDADGVHQVVCGDDLAVDDDLAHFVLWI